MVSLFGLSETHLCTFLLLPQTSELIFRIISFKILCYVTFALHSNPPKSVLCLEVELARMTKSKPSGQPTGLMTIRAMIEKRRYRIVEVIDDVTDESYTLIQARRRGMIDLKTQEYVFSDTGERIPLDEAIGEGLVTVEFEEEIEDVNNNEKEEAPELETRTYAINSVVDQQKRKNVSFPEAMERGLILPKSGNYHHNVTGQETYVVEAIEKGYVEGRKVEDTTDLNVDKRSRIVVELIGRIRKNILNPLSVIIAFRRAARQVDFSVFTHL